MDKCEKDQTRLREDFDSTNRHLGEIETENKRFQKVMVKSLQALSEHAIDGNNTEQLKKAITELNEYLIEKV